jgi:hypothetical protein
MSKLIDALIIGGGPAGASAALLLARAGWTVALVEKKIFPRVKVCGEFISATSLPLIQELGVLDYYLEHAGPAIQRLAWFTENKIVTADMPIANNALSAWGRALGRDLLDTCLLKEAQSAGAKIWQPWRAQELIQKGDHFICKISNKEEIAEIKVRIPIIAHGSWEQGVNHTEQIKHKNTDLLAFKTHFAQSNLKGGMEVWYIQITIALPFPAVCNVMYCSKFAYKIQECRQGMPYVVTFVLIVKVFARLSLPPFRKIVGYRSDLCVRVFVLDIKRGSFIWVTWQERHIRLLLKVLVWRCNLRGY